MSSRAGLSTSSGSAEPSARLSELVTSRLADLTDDQVSSLKIVVLGEPIGFDEAVRLGARDRRARAARPRRRHTVPATDRAATRARQLRRVLRRRLPVTRGRELRRQLAEGLMRAGARRRGDALLLATLLLDSDGTGPAGGAPSRRSRVLRQRPRARRADRTCREDAEPSFETRHLLQSVMYRLGVVDAVLDVAADAGSDAERGLHVMHRRRRVRQQGDHETGDRLLAEGVARSAAGSPARRRDDGDAR